MLAVSLLPMCAQYQVVLFGVAEAQDPEGHRVLHEAWLVEEMLRAKTMVLCPLLPRTLQDQQV